MYFLVLSGYWGVFRSYSSKGGGAGLALTYENFNLGGGVGAPDHRYTYLGLLCVFSAPNFGTVCCCLVEGGVGGKPTLKFFLNYYTENVDIALKR